MSNPVAETVERLQTAFGAAPVLAVVLGSGWAGATECLQAHQVLPYAELPAFARSRVQGHVDEIVVGTLEQQRVAMLRGRVHCYESGDSAAMAGTIRSLQAWGVQILVLTNAAGSLRAAMHPGSLMLLQDYINATQRSPLLGAEGNARFVDMVHAYDPALRARARHIATEHGTALCEGVYLWAMGPQFETPAEIRMFAAWGADAVGMSTVPETILARHCGLRVLGLSLITNFAAGLSDTPLSHAATLQQAEDSSAAAVHYLARLLADLSRSTDSPQPS